MKQRAVSITPRTWSPHREHSRDTLGGEAARDHAAWLEKLQPGQRHGKLRRSAPALGNKKACKRHGGTRRALKQDPVA